MRTDLTGRRAVVTGGSKGIGLAVAAELATEGAQVAICARTATEVEDAVGHLSELGRPARGWVCDVRQADQVQRFIDAAAEAMNGIDILVNNAGAAHPGGFEQLTDGDWQEDIDVKLFAQIRAVRAALPWLRKSPVPRVVNINAVFGRQPDPAFFATSVNRAACLSLSKTLAMEFGPEGILVNSVNVGFVATPQWQHIRQLRSPGSTEEEFFARMAAGVVPLGRFGEADDVAGVVGFLCSDRGKYLTGVSIDVGGGMGTYV